MNKKIIIIFLCTLFLDQISKSIVASCLSVGKSIKLIKDFFYITYLNNYGAAWSLFSDKNTFLIIVSIVFVIIIYRFMYVFDKNKRNSLAFGLILGGIIGNLIDRWLFGYVRDFIDFKIFGYDYPVFNIADMAVVVGVLLLIIAIIKGEDKDGKDISTRR